MTDTPQQAPSSVPGNTSYSPAPSSAPAPQQSVDVSSLLRELETWQSRYNGQQGTLQREVEAKRSALAQLAELNTEREREKANYEAQLREIQEKYKTIEQQALERQAALQKYERQRETRQFIAQNYPDLMSPYDEGLIPADHLEGDALKSHLEKFATFFRGTRQEAVVKAVSGGVPPAPPPAAAAQASSEDIQARLMKMNPLSPEYRKLFDEWIAITDQEKKK